MPSARHTGGWILNSSTADLSVVVHAGAHGEEMLLRMLTEEPTTRVMTALGEASGAKGESALRYYATDVDTEQDLRCSALVALAKRAGRGASDVFALCITDSNKAVRRYALRCLAYTGDDRAWDTVVKYLQKSLSLPAPKSPGKMNPQTMSIQSENLPAIGYLARHAVGPARAAQALSLVRANWGKLYTAEQKWITDYWAACAPGGSDAPVVGTEQATRIVGWLAVPLFSPIY